jgi:hypothetical protein
MTYGRKSQLDGPIAIYRILSWEMSFQAKGPEPS